jgi:tellurite resistance-related uncharacterized protein
MTRLPAGLVRGRRTPTFTAETVPFALTKAHLTAAWAVVEVEAGSLVFADEVTGDRVVLEAGARHVIVPGQRHHVEPDDAAAFAVQFWDEE